MLRELTLTRPPVVRFGCGCRSGLTDYIVRCGHHSVVFLCSPSSRDVSSQLAEDLRRTGADVGVIVLETGEPSVTQFEKTLAAAKKSQPDCVVGIGGGSPLDVAKLVAALLRSTCHVSEFFGIGLLEKREVALICLPSTAGTGSEVSPNAILLDERENLKKGVISPFLVPDATFIDPELALTVPSRVTAFTGLDTLTHCIEAYTNKFAHPLVDIYALEGIRLTAKYLLRAVRNGRDLEAREGMAAASYLGGLCLGPVNTAAVHALAYPLGSRYHIAHGLSNAVLLPAVSRVNLVAVPERYADVAKALGATGRSSPHDTAEEGIALIEKMLKDCEVDTDLAVLGIPADAVPELAVAAASVTRLLRNNPVELTVADIQRIYEGCFRAN